MCTRQTKILYAIKILLLSGLLLILSGNKIGSAIEFPSRPVEIIIGFAPGGTADLGARAMSYEFSKNLGVPVIVNNKAGAGGAIGTEYASRAKPDGYTILLAEPGSLIINLLLTPGLRYKLSDFIHLCKYFDTQNLVLVRKDSPFKSYGDLISYAKANPGKLTCGTSGFGQASHFMLEMIKIQAGLDIAHLPFKSGAEVNTALLSGAIDYAHNGLPPSIGLLKSGDLRALASNTFDKVPGFPDIPTLSELGYPKAVLITWFGFFLPKGTPKPIVDKLASVFEKVINNPTVKQRVENQGVIVRYWDSPTFSKYITEQKKVLEDVARKAKMIK